MTNIKRECVFRIIKYDVKRITRAVMCSLVLLLPTLINILLLLRSGALSEYSYETRLCTLNNTILTTGTIMVAVLSFFNICLIIKDGLCNITCCIFIITTITHLVMIVLIFTNAFWSLSIELLIFCVVGYIMHVMFECKNRKIGD